MAVSSRPWGAGLCLRSAAPQRSSRLASACGYLDSSRKRWCASLQGGGALGKAGKYRTAVGGGRSNHGRPNAALPPRRAAAPCPHSLQVGSINRCLQKLACQLQPLQVFCLAAGLQPQRGGAA